MYIYIHTEKQLLKTVIIFYNTFHFIHFFIYILWFKIYKFFTGNAGSVCTGQQPWCSNPAETGRHDRTEQKSHTGDHTKLSSCLISSIRVNREIVSLRWVVFFHRSGFKTAERDIKSTLLSTAALLKLIRRPECHPRCPTSCITLHSAVLREHAWWPCTDTSTVSDSSSSHYREQTNPLQIHCSFRLILIIIDHRINEHILYIPWWINEHSKMYCNDNRCDNIIL